MDSKEMGVRNQQQADRCYYCGIHVGSTEGGFVIDKESNRFVLTCMYRFENGQCKRV